MISQGILRKIPDSPGVYFFLNRQKKVLYIGRATSLCSRVRSYLSFDIADKRSSWIEKMVNEAKGVDFRKTDSVLEAIFLEADLIKKFQPKYNTDLKDDKSFNCIVITKEDFPRVLVARKKDIDFSALQTSNYKLKTIFGPFPHGTKLHEALKIVRKIFPFRDSRCKPMQGKSCFNRQIGLCPGICTGEISMAEYRKVIQNLMLFLSAKKEQLLTRIEKEMRSSAKVESFERASELKRQLFALKHIQDVALIKPDSSVPLLCSSSVSLPCTFRIEAYDLSHFGGKNIVGAMIVLEGGRPKRNDYRLFKLRGIKNADEVKGLQEVLTRRFKHTEWPFPQALVVDGNNVQKTTAEDVLRSLKLTIPVVAVTKNAHHKPERVLGLELTQTLTEATVLLANSEAHRFVLQFQKKQRVL